MNAIYYALSYLPQLTHLSNAIQTTYDPFSTDSEFRLNLLLKRLSEAAPNLRCLDVGENKERKWLVIERKEDGKYGGYRWIEKKEFKRQDVIVDEWGGFYFVQARKPMYRRGRPENKYSLLEN